jgi:hypothetical protein
VRTGPQGRGAPADSAWIPSASGGLSPQRGGLENGFRSGRFERVTGRKARGLQMEKIGHVCQTFVSLLSCRRKQTSIFFFLLYTNLKEGFP